MKNKLIAVIGCMVSQAAWLTAIAADEVVQNGSELTFNVASGSYTWSGSIPSDVTTIRKIGGGEFKFGTDSNTFTGTFTVEEGRVTGKGAAFGTPSLLDVWSGASVEFTDNTNTSCMTADTLVKIAGSGTNNDGTGALRFSGNNNSWYRLCDNLELAADSTIWLASGSGRNIAKNINMNGHTLTTAGSGTTGRRGAALTVTNPGDFNVRGPFNLEDAKIVGDGTSLAGHWLNFNGTFDVLFKLTHTFAEPLELGVGIRSGTATMKLLSVTGGKNAVAGPLAVDSGSTLNIQGYNNSALHFIQFSGGVSGEGSISFPSGVNSVDAVFAGPFTNNLGYVTMANASLLTLTNRIHVKTSGVSVNGGTVASPATLRVAGGAALAYRSDISLTSADRSLFVKNGIVEINGGIVSNDVCIAAGSGGTGAIYMDGGQLYVGGGTKHDTPYFGNYGYGYSYVALAGGNFTLANSLTLGQVNASSLFCQKSGVFQFNGDGWRPIKLGCYGQNTYGHYRHSGGTSHLGGIIALGMVGTSNWSGSGVKSVYTVDGTATVNAEWGYVYMYSATNAAEAANGKFQTGIVNFNGGNAHIRRIARRVEPYNDANWNTVKGYVDECCKFYVNFNGGTLTPEAGEFFVSSEKAPNRVTVYEGGATIDTAGKDVTWRLPLLRPSGKGLKSVTLPAEALVAKAYLGPARIRINGTNGHTADAVMDFDEKTRTVTGVTVTAPGNDLGDDISVTVEKSDHVYSNVYTAEDGVSFEVETLAATGGLTKKGAGTLTLLGANTYGGATRVEGGTLAFSNDAGYPGGDLEIPAAAVQGELAAPLVTANALAFGEGRGVRLTEADTLDADTFGKPKTIATFTTPLASVPALALVASDGTPVPVRRYRLMLKSGGRELQIGVQRGLHIVVF